MYKRKRYLAFIALSMLLVSSCGQKQVSNKTAEQQTFFELRGDTVKDKDVKTWNIDKYIQDNNTAYKEESKNDENEYAPHEHAGEIILENGTHSANYKVSNDDIIYNNILFHDLYKNAKSIEQPYSEQTFISFIINTYSTKETEVYSSVENDNDFVNLNNTDGDNTYIPVDETLYDNANHKKICNKYNDKATWKLEVYEYGLKNKGIIAGCKSFICFIGILTRIAVFLVGPPGCSKTLCFNSLKREMKGCHSP